MRILALETSTEYCSVALWQDGAVMERCELVGQKHSEMLIAMIDGLLQTTGHKLQAMDGIAFGKGPGSFTGVRIACGVAQGLAFGAGLPVAGVCTLEALAEASGKEKVIAALDARMGEIYHAAYERCDAAWVTVSEPRLCKPEDAPQILGNDWFGAGSGFAHTLSPNPSDGTTSHSARLRNNCSQVAGYPASGRGEMLVARYAGQLSGVDATAVPQAAAIAVLGAAQFARGSGKDAAEALPLYLRDKVALKTSERECAR